MLFSKASIVLSAALLYSAFSNAAKWIDTDNLTLRHHIQLLADTGILSAPTSTYPLKWASIAGDLNKAQSSNLSASQQYALNYVLAAYQAQQKTMQLNVRLQASKNERFFTGFGDEVRDKAKLTASAQYNGERFFGKLSLNALPAIDDATNYSDQNTINVDYSYVAMTLGNWLLSAGSVSQWYGPGLDTSLVLSNNARPMPGITVSRNDSSAFETPWLSWIGPWTYTATMSKLEQQRFVPDALLFQNRGTLRPFTGLELGISWVAQWGGEGQPSGVSDFFDIILGKEDCAVNIDPCPPGQDTQFGNQLAGYDVRWSDTLFELPYALYYQTIGEDKSPNFGVTDKGHLFGIEIRPFVNNTPWLFNLEYTDTFAVDCGGRGGVLGNCYYEHNIYESGYRYHRRSIGGQYDNDATSVVLTVLAPLSWANHWQSKLRYIELNKDNSDKYKSQPWLGNTLSKVAQELWQFDNQVSFNMLDSQVMLGVSITQRDDGVQSDTDANVYGSWQYNF
ncbi:capsule assembly Wzi family protein [Thalassotalea agarivorans]|uniref:Capsule assembly protein Wzi n=1 Tax=Thalassotalea agarivorans TaxID=349064 RepID=A0A1I0HVR9_THASX|nr:capsule assembly Wzi family protein [Thalassotalea agarivorans]SET87385.1 Capsule assembly protein Wzi [Thalassotalea agarivorans]